MAAEAKTRAIITVAEIAAMSGVSDMTVRRWRRALSFPKPLYPPALSRTLLFDRVEIEHWLSAQREGRAP
ncbi:MAG: helix-turn-helix domain-containing protein [Hyphomonadaceae bacterium]|nr:helix-turn-helix domain-containing protein [Hyphomonadaceae bacterium]